MLVLGVARHKRVDGMVVVRCGVGVRESVPVF